MAVCGEPMSVVVVVVVEASVAARRGHHPGALRRVAAAGAVGRADGPLRRPCATEIASRSCGSTYSLFSVRAF